MRLIAGKVIMYDPKCHLVDMNRHKFQLNIRRKGKEEHL